MYKLSPFKYSFGSGKPQKIFLEKELTFKMNEIIAVIGPSGGGKTTFLKILKGIIPEYSSGVLEGEVLFHGQKLTGVNFQENLKKILYLFQNPFSQLIYPTPEEEFLFSMENFNFSREQMDEQRDKFEELFALRNIWGKKNSQLSNGECQKLVLASLLAINPEVLLLDEPTAFLDPQARAEFYGFLEKIKGERLVIIIDHHVGELKNFITRTIGVSIEGKIEEQTGFNAASEMALPGLNLEDLFHPMDTKLSISNINFSFSNSETLLKNVNAHFSAGEIIAIKGKNGVGKSTLFKILAGIIEGLEGQVSLSLGKKTFVNRKIFPHVGFIFQNPETHFFYDTVAEELKQSFKHLLSPALKEEILGRFFHDIDLTKSPFLLSEGEKRRLSILMTVFMEKSLILYDEPTFGQDQKSVLEISLLMKELKSLGLIQLFISHDEHFINTTADRIFFLENGSLNEIS